MLAVPLSGRILQSLSTGPKQRAEVRREAGSPAQSTLRSHLRGLQASGAIVKHRHHDFPGALDFELAEPGRELLTVLSVLRRWLSAAPDGPLELGTDPARAAIKALAEGWSSAMLRALAAGPLTLTDLDSLISAFNYPSLERRLGAMRLARLVEPVPANGRGTPYRVTNWLRHGIGPLAAASRWERRYLPDKSPHIGRTEAEAMLMLAVPASRLPSDLSGACRPVVELSKNTRTAKHATVTVAAKDGKVVSCTSRGGDARAWAAGPASAWFSAGLDADTDYLELGGDRRLARGLLEGLHGVLFEAGARSSQRPPK
jgi:DNA-binding HxlR family transcriptional regulator